VRGRERLVRGLLPAADNKPGGSHADPGEPFLPAAPNVTYITVSQQCPQDSTDHLEIAFDPVSLADMLNALDPAQPVQVPCLTVRAITGPVGQVPSF
jgi:hypothetical protein